MRMARERAPRVRSRVVLEPVITLLEEGAG